MKKLKVKFSLLILVSIILGLFFLFGRAGLNLRSCEELRSHIFSDSVAGTSLYLFFATVAMVFLIPRTPIVVLAGICFGSVWGTFWAMLASMLSSFVVFAISRKLGRSSVEKIFRKRKWFYKLERFSHHSGFHLVLLARATHILNFGAVNWVCGVLDMTLGAFLWGTFLGVFPGTVILVYGSQRLGCPFWEGKLHLTPSIIYLSVITSVFMVLTSVLPLWLSQKKSK